MTAIPTFEKPFSEITVPELKAAITEKFGNVSRFCKITKRERYEFHKLLRLKQTPDNLKLIEKAFEDAKKTENKLLSNELTDELREKLRAGIYAKAKNILEFCEKHSEYPNTWLSGVINGRVAKITPKVKELAKLVNVSIPKAK